MDLVYAKHVSSKAVTLDSRMNVKELSLLEKKTAKHFISNDFSRQRKADQVTLVLNSPLYVILKMYLSPIS